MERIIRKFESRKHNVFLIENGKELFVRKVFVDKQSYYRELSALKDLQAINVPKILNNSEFFIDMEYINGSLFLDEFLSLQEYSISALAKSLAIYLKSYMKVRKNTIPSDVNFRNFILKEGVCYGLDFEESQYGTLSECVAKIIAFCMLYDVEKTKKDAFICSLLKETQLTIKQTKEYIEKDIDYLINRRKKI